MRKRMDQNAYLSSDVPIAHIPSRLRTNSIKKLKLSRNWLTVIAGRFSFFKAKYLD